MNQINDKHLCEEIISSTYITAFLTFSKIATHIRSTDGQTNRQTLLVYLLLPQLAILFLIAKQQNLRLSQDFQSTVACWVARENWWVPEDGWLAAS